ncbi:MAG: type II secretion system F family protein [Candidatus Methanomethylophilus sp.]|nr:type II secretion system F family protein [Methanomethylophilus sp.]
MKSKAPDVKIKDRIQLDKDKLVMDKTIKELETQSKIAQKELELNWFEKKKRELKQANIGLTFPTYMVILALSMLAIFVIVNLIMGIPILALMFSFVGILVPEKVVEHLVSKNIDKFNSQLIQALRRMSSIMRSGGSLKQALKGVSDSNSISQVVRYEFRKVLIDMEYGLSIEEAFFKLYERTGSKDIQFLAVAIEVQRQLGGNIAQIIDSIAQNISNRELMQSDVKATLAQINATSNILSIMPFALCGIVIMINPGYFSVLFGSLFGKTIVLACLCLLIAGVFVIKKMSYIKL